VYARPGIVLLLMFDIATPVLAAHCSVSTQSLAFGNYDIFFPGPLDATTYLSIQCDTPAPFRVSMDSGANNNGGFLFRNMSSGAEMLSYNLYLDSARNMVWGDGRDGSDVLIGEGALSPQRIPVYGRIPAGQNAGVGTYSDSIIVNIDL